MHMTMNPILTQSRFTQAACLASVAMMALFTPAAHAGWVDDAVDEVTTIIKTGDEQLYVSGYAYHGRKTYTAAKIATLNEHAWGLGYAKTLRSADAHRGVFSLIISDSHRQLQPMIGYTYEKPYYFNADWFIAGGLAPMIVQRQDMVKKFPFPAIFPLLSIGNQKVEAKFVYIPRLSKNLGNGDVLYAFASYKF